MHDIYDEIQVKHIGIMNMILLNNVLFLRNEETKYAW